MYFVPMNGMKLVIKKSIAEDFLKSYADRKLEYFKKELLKVLDRQEKEESPEVSKAFIVHELYKSMTDPLYMAKGGKAGVVGEIRTWNGKKYKKMPNKKWVRIYDTHDKHTEISIARLKGRVRRVQSVEELFDIVMNNTHRFSDENGKPLDIVLELKKEVDARKKTLNAGKPSTKEQVEKIKKEQKKKNQSSNDYGFTELEVKDLNYLFNNYMNHSTKKLNWKAFKAQLDLSTRAGNKILHKITKKLCKDNGLTLADKSKLPVNAVKDAIEDMFMYHMGSGGKSGDEPSKNKQKNQKVELTEKQKENLEKINDILNKNVETFPVGEFSEDNFKKLFENGIDSPIEHIKIGENQYQKLIEKNRQDLIVAMADVMKKPALIMKTDTGAKIYAKTYERENHKKTVISVIVDKGKLHISISTHIEKNKQLAKKMDSILFDRTESVHGDNASRENTPDNSNIAQDYNDVNKKIKIDIKDFPEQFNKGKWKKQTKILMDFMNSQNGDSIVKSLYKKLSVLKNDLPFKIAKAEKKFANGSFSVVCDRATMKPEEQRIHIKDITDESEYLKKSSCMEALHEIMHMIDFSCRDNKNSPDYASNSNRQLVNAINNAKVSDEEIKSLEGHFADYRAKERVIIDKLNAKARETRELGKQYDSGAITTYSEYGEKYKAIQKEYEAEQKKLNELRAKEIEVSQYTDILDALSGGKLHDDKGFGGHGETYYRKESNKANEIVANYASLLAVGSEYADRLKKNYPELADSVYNLYRQFLER